jgi:hypothetical protein
MIMGMKNRLDSLLFVVAIGSSVLLQDSLASSAMAQTMLAAQEESRKTGSPKQVFGQRPEKHRLRIGKIDFFGYGDLSPAKLREALPVLQGESISQSAWRLARPKIDDAIKRLTGAGPTDVATVCCDDHGAAMIYVGIAGSTSKPLGYNPTPRGPVRLPAQALVLEKRFEEAVAKAVQEGKAGEDDSNGYALSAEPTVRASQLSVRKFTMQHSTLVREVLQSSEAVEHRRAAAEFLGYDNASIKQVEALTQASRDPDSIVRNNAVRGLAVLADSGRKTHVKVPGAPFVDMLGADKWTDRNKGTFALMNLTQSRDRELLAELGAKAMPALIEMARWQETGHASGARILLGRIAGMAEVELVDLSGRNDQAEAIIRAAQRVH